GNYAYSTSGVTSTQFDNVQVNAARVPDGASIGVVVQVVTSAQTGHITYSGGALTSNVTLEVGGNGGTEQLSFASGTTVSSIATAINGVKAATGVSATVAAGTLSVNSTEFGAEQFVSLKTISGTFSPSASKDFGRDAAVKVNGASGQADGINVSYRSGNLDLQFDLDSTFNK